MTDTMKGPIDWQRVAQTMLHPTQVEILEAAASSERISPVQLARGKTGLGSVAYHVRALRDAGLLEAAGTEPRRGATEHFYRLADTARE